MSERDYPKGHPAASDYAGEHWVPPIAPHSEDYPVGHPARGGRNTGVLDSPDGLRNRVLADHEHNAQQTAAMLEQLKEADAADRQDHE